MAWHVLAPPHRLLTQSSPDVHEAPGPPSGSHTPSRQVPDAQPTLGVHASPRSAVSTHFPPEHTDL